MPENRKVVIAKCESGHNLTYDDVAKGRCPRRGCPTPDLYPGKQPVPQDAPKKER
jgi:hypothetical protein